jgi:hypothetical protein
MAINPETNSIERLQAILGEAQSADAKMQGLLRALPGQLLRPDGSPVPDHWTKMAEGELVVVIHVPRRVLQREDVGARAGRADGGHQPIRLAPRLAGGRDSRHPLSRCVNKSYGPALFSLHNRTACRIYI